MQSTPIRDLLPLVTIILCIDNIALGRAQFIHNPGVIMDVNLNSYEYVTTPFKAANKILAFIVRFSPQFLITGRQLCPTTLSQEAG